MDSNQIELEKRIIRLEAMLEAKAEIIDILKAVMDKQQAPLWVSNPTTTNPYDVTCTPGGLLTNAPNGSTWTVSSSTTDGCNKPTGLQNTTAVDKNPMSPVFSDEAAKSMFELHGL
tara:strand:+ start:129844 stop:130191 length:348 start_codon:yes stop_codon:yes gene_type:complete